MLQNNPKGEGHADHANGRQTMRSLTNALAHKTIGWLALKLWYLLGCQVLLGHDAWKKKIFSQMVDLDADESRGTK